MVANDFVQMENEKLIPLLIAAGGGGNAYLEDPESTLDEIPLEQYENDTVTAGLNGRTGAAGLCLLQIVYSVLYI